MGASPLEQEKSFKISDHFQYALPSFTSTGFNEKTGGAAHSGHLWYGNYHLSLPGIVFFGENLWPWNSGKWEIHSVLMRYGAFGYLWRWSWLKIYINGGFGSYYANDMAEEINDQLSRGWSHGVFTLGFGISLNLWGIFLKIETSLGGNFKDSLFKSTIDIGYCSEKSWKAGLFFNGVNRRFQPCGDDDKCDTDNYLQDLTSITFYGGYYLHPYWIKAGLQLSRNYSFGFEDQKEDLVDDQFGLVSIYLSFE